MAQTFASNVVVKNAVKAVTVPLEDGLCSVKKIYMKLIEAQVDPHTGQCSNYDDLRNQIVLAKQKLEQSEQVAGTGLRSLDTSIENLIKDEGKLEQERSDIQCFLENVKTEQTSNKYSLKHSEDALEQARINLISIGDTILRQEKRKLKAKILTGVGGGLFLIPVIGWIAGSAMVTTGALKLSRATHAVRSAEEEVRKFESQIQKYKSKVSEYKVKITKAERNITQKKDQADKIRKDIQKAKENHAAVADLQIKVKKIVHILSILSGKASVVEGQTRSFILQEPVIKVMKDLLIAAEKILGNKLLFDESIPKRIHQLLSDEGIPKHIHKMRGHNQKLLNTIIPFILGILFFVFFSFFNFLKNLV